MTEDVDEHSIFHVNISFAGKLGGLSHLAEDGEKILRWFCFGYLDLNSVSQRVELFFSPSSLLGSGPWAHSAVVYRTQISSRSAEGRFQVLEIELNIYLSIKTVPGPSPGLCGLTNEHSRAWG